MIKTYILRLVSERLSGGETVGRAEEVDTGRSAVVHNTGHLLGFLLGNDGDGEQPDEPPRATDSDEPGSDEQERP